MMNSLINIFFLVIIGVFLFGCSNCDSDGDGCPNKYDDFPNDSHYMTDSDKDGLADNDPEEFDADGDNLIDFDKHPVYGIDSVLTLKEPCSGHYGEDDCDGIF